MNHYKVTEGIRKEGTSSIFLFSEPETENQENKQQPVSLLLTKLTMFLDVVVS